MTALQPIDRSALDPFALDLGLAAGLLSNAGDTQVTVNQAWFNDPLSNAAQGLRSNGQDLAALLGAIFGKVEGNALAIPSQDPTALGTWYPIGRPGAKPGDPPTGLYVVTYTQGAEQVFGLGVKHVWAFGGDGEHIADASMAKLDVTVWGILPILRAGPLEKDDIGAMLVLGSKANPMMLGISATSPGGPIIDGAGLSLGGGRLSVQISFDKDDPVSVTLEILQLQLPDETKPSDRSLADLKNITGQELLSTVAALLITGLTKVTGQDARTKYLMPLFGLATSVPGVADVQLPILQWFSLAANPNDLAKPFRDWFNALASDPSKLKAWLACVTGLLSAPGTTVTGSGTRADPFAAPVVALGESGALSFTMASLVDDSGARVVFPGLAVTSTHFVIGSSSFAVLLQAALELFQFTLNGNGSSAISSLRFDADMRLVDATAGKPLFSGAGYRIGYLAAGLELTGNLAVIPSFVLVDVQTPNGKFASLDLTAPTTLADVAEEALITAIDTALQKLLGVDPNSPQPVPFASALAAMVGFIPPTNLPEGKTWPVPPPFSAKQLASSLKNPIAALGSYWSQLLQFNEQLGQTPFFYMLGELAGLMQIAAAEKTPIAVTGDGTAALPWLAAISTDILPAFVSAYVVSEAGGTLTLTTGLRVGPSITVGGTTIAFAVYLDMVALDFPTDQRATSAQWLPRIGAALSLPDGGATPAVLGATFKVSNVAISAGWSHSVGWAWSILAQKPTVTIDGTDFPLGQDLDFSDPGALRKLVTDSGKIFAPILLGALGIALSRGGTRAGIAATALFGLLPELSGKLPDGLPWPSDMPRLTITALDNPLPDLTKQLAGLVATEQHAKAALTLLAWAMTPSANNPPVLPGSGTRDDPFQIAIAGLDPWSLSAWIDPAQSGLGFGLIYQQSATVAAIDVATTVRLDVAELSFAGATAGFAPVMPALSLALAAKNWTGLLVDRPDLGVTLAAASFTTILSLTSDGGGTAAWTLALTPSDGSPAVVQHDTSFADSNDPTYENLALALALEAVSTGLTANATFQTVYGLLTSAGLTLPSINGAGYGLNVGGWRSFISDPTGYLTDRARALLTDPANRDALFGVVLQAVGLPSFTIPKPVLITLQALGVVLGPDQGYAVSPSAIMALARSPFATLAARFRQLTQDQATLRALIGQFGQSRIVEDFWILRFEVANSARVSLGLAPGNTFAVGNLLDITGRIDFDLQTFALTATVPVAVREIGLAIVPALTLQPTAPHVTRIAAVAPSFAIGVAWGTAGRRAPAPLPIYPFSPSAFLDGLADVAPQYVLSAFVTGLLQSQLLADYPLAQNFFKGLGVAFTGKDGQLQMPSLLGLLTDPIAWFTDIGLFELSTLQGVLTALPDVGTGGLALQTITNGKRVAGLPYGLQIDLTVDLAGNRAALTPNLGAPFSIAQGAATLETLSLSLGVDTTFQPSIAGALRVGGVVPTDNKIFASLAYDKSFTVAVGEDTANGAVFQLVPFPSWTTLVLAIVAKAEQEVLREVAKLLLDELAKEPSAATFVANLRQSATDLAVPDLVNAIINVQTDPAQIEAVALKWLRDRISDANIGKTSSSIATLLGSLVPGFSSKDGLITYAPTGALPIKISAGLEAADGNKVLGLWADLNYIAASILQVSVARTGVAIPISGPVTPTVTFAAGLCALIEGTTGPTLTFSFDSGSGALTLSVDPLGGDSDLKRELLPKLFGVPPEQVSNAIEEWLLKVLLFVVPRYLVDAVLMVDEVDKWMRRGIVPQNETLEAKTTYAGPKPGEVLSSSQILVSIEQPSERYVLNSLENLKKLTIAQFLSGFFIALLKNEVKLLTIDKGGIWIAKPKQLKDESAYGLRVALPDINIPGLDNIVFQLGATDTAWIKDAHGDPDALEPGLSFLVPIDPNKGPNFAASIIDLINVGIDIVGAKGKPLVDMSRFQLGSLKPRGLVELAFGQDSLVPIFGGALTIDQMAISLAPNAVTGGGNQVAQNLLGSGDDDKQKNPPTNPGFSLLVGYLKQPSGGNLAVELMGPDGTSKTKVWIPVQRSFGPLHVNQVGLGYIKPDKALVLFDGSLALFGFNASVQDLEVGIPVTDITNYDKYSLDLGGLEVSYNGGSLTIAGGLLKEEDPDTHDISYSGAASVQAGQFGLTAFGSYAMIATSTDHDAKKAPSLFVFAVLKAPLGGPPAFFIMGAAGGFAYNRDLIVPPIEGVVDFPFIKGARDPSYFGNDDPGKALATLGKASPPKVGAYWAAAGIFFTTFKLLDTFALAMVQFGSEFAVNILGVSTISQPPEVGPDQALVYLELAMKLSFRPSDGVFSMEAQLTPNSFVLTKECRVTGGFAFYLWFKDDKKLGISSGDFVLTVGGYSPRFTKPDFYPPVPILGLNWPVIEGVNVGGGVYLALTPSAFMVGGFLKATFEAGPLQAWFDASADVLIAWQPFYFVADISISVGVAFEVEVAGVHMRLSASLGASLALEGPPVHGKVHVSWYIISFTIPFGEGPDPDENTLTWVDFENAFLPPPQPANQQLAMEFGVIAEEPLQQVVKATSQIGLLSSTKDAKGEDWTIGTAPLSIRIDSVIPMTVATIETGPSFTGADIGVPPVGVTTVKTPLSLNLKYKDKNGDYQPVILANTGLGFSDGRAGAPEAMWSKSHFNPDGTPTANVVPNALTSLVMAGDEYVVGSEIGPIDLLKAFEFVEAHCLPLAYDQMPVYTPAAPMAQGSFEQIMAKIGATIMSSDPANNIVARRSAMFAALTDAGLYTPASVDLSVMARFASSLFQAPPIMAELSETLAGNGGAALGRNVSGSNTEKAAVPSAPATPGDQDLRLIGSLSRYRRSAGAALRGVAATQAAATARPANVFVDLTNRLGAAGAPGGDRKIRLHDGGYELWQISGGAQARVAAQGGVPVRIVAFDTYTDLLDDRILPPGGTMQLPEGTAMLALQHAAHLAPDHGQLTGWTLRTELLQANCARFVGDGFTVKPHGDPRWRRRGRIQRHGMMDAPTMLRRNRTRRGPGWIETSFLPEMKSMIVTVTGGGNPAAAVDVQLPIPDAEAPYAKLAPVSVIASNGATLLVYDLGPAPAAGPHRVLVRCEDSCAIEGCHAWSGRAADFERALAGLHTIVGGMIIGTAPTEAVALLSVEPQPTRVETDVP